MDAASTALAKENAALKAELAVAHAKASEDMALIAAQKLRINLGIPTPKSSCLQKKYLPRLRQSWAVPE